MFVVFVEFQDFDCSVERVDVIVAAFCNDELTLGAAKWGLAEERRVVGCIVGCPFRIH